MSTACHYPTDGSDAQWEALQLLLPPPKWRLGGPGRKPMDLRHVINADFRSRKLTHNGQGQGYSKTNGRLRNHGIGRHPLSRAASRRLGLCARLSKRTTRRSAWT
jgi:hypothetical protein